MRAKNRIVLIDDNRALAGFIGDLLNSRGYELLLIHSADKAHSFLDRKNDNIYAVILDYNIGRITSDVLAKRFRKEHPNSIIIVASGYSRRTYAAIQGLIDSKIIDAFIEKPFSFPDLCRLLRS